MSRLAAVLFDMDGLLIDSEPVWTVAESDFAARLGSTFTPEIKAAIVGTRLEVAVPTMLRAYGRPDDDASVAEASSWLLGRVVELFAQDLAVLPGVTELVAALRSAAIPIALVSSSYRVLVDAALRQGLGPFDVTIAGDEVTHGKPHPEPYLLAARLLGVPPEQCVVLEDSPSGVDSAEAAGCAVVAVPSVAGVHFTARPRRLVTTTLESVGIAELERLTGTHHPNGLFRLTPSPT